jgi:hypothetical protein
MSHPLHFWIPFTTVITLVTTGCSQFPSLSTNSPSPTVPSPVVSVSPTAISSATAEGTAPTPTPSVAAAVLWEQALERAATAEELSQSAQSRDDWSLVSNRWEQAIALLRSIPSSDPRHTEVERKVSEYKGKLTAAQQRANITTPNVTLTAPIASETPSPNATPSPTAANSAAVALATHLNTVGTTLYFRDGECADCQQQRELLGPEAIAKLSVVTCTPTATLAPTDPDPCGQANVTTYPTWRINNQLYPGVQSLEQLAELSGYEAESAS